jgi:hypothetical protein
LKKRHKDYGEGAGAKMQKNGYGELMAKYVGNRWLYIDRNKEGNDILKDRDENPTIRNAETKTTEQTKQLTGSIVGRHETKRE